MKKIGLVLPHLGSSQPAFYTIIRANDFIEKYNNRYDIVLFYQNLVAPCVRPLCSTMCVNELPNFNGTIISSTIDNTITAKKLSISKRIIFYMWDVEWLRVGKQNFLYNIQAFDKDITLIARSKDHIRLVENYANRTVNGMIENFNLQEILEI